MAPDAEIQDLKEPGARTLPPMAADTQICHTTSLEYWQTVDADVNGMLGGFPYVSKIDLQGSRNFLAKVGVGGRRKSLRGKEDGKVTGNEKVTRAVDCGAGIGRVTTGLLLSIASTVDIVEPIAKFTDALNNQDGVGQIFNIGLEKWNPEKQYNLIWNQWCVGHLTDEQLVAYLLRCGTTLSPGGWIIVKENLSSGTTDIYDETDSSVTRTEMKFKSIFEKAGLKIKRTELQRGMPKELYLVRIWALQPVAK